MGEREEREGPRRGPELAVAKSVMAARLANQAPLSAKFLPDNELKRGIRRLADSHVAQGCEETHRHLMPGAQGRKGKVPCLVRPTRSPVRT